MPLTIDDPQRQHEPYAVIVLQQIARAAEPREKRGDGAELNHGRSAVPDVHAVRQVQVWQVHVRASAQQRKHAQAESQRRNTPDKIRPSS